MAYQNTFEEFSIVTVVTDPRQRTPQRSFRHALYALMVCNLLDAFFTLHWVVSGVATEANPVMAWALEAGPWVFVLAKISLVSLGVVLIAKYSSRAFVRAITVPVLVLYAFIVGTHLHQAITTSF